MALETTTTTSMENGYGYGLPSYGYGGGGYGQDFGSKFCDVQQAIGDAKATLLMRAGDSEARLGSLISSGDSALGTEIGDAECAIIDRMGTYAADHNKNAADIALAQAVALNGFERDIQNRVHETRQILTKEIGDKASRTEDIINSNALRVADQLALQFSDVKNQLRAFEISNAKQFSVLEVEGLKNTSKVLEQMSANKYDALKDEVDAIRADRHADKYSYNFGLQNQELSYLKQMIGSVENNQRFGSKTVQFGTGNTSGTAQTANQG